MRFRQFGRYSHFHKEHGFEAAVKRKRARLQQEQQQQQQSQSEEHAAVVNSQASTRTKHSQANASQHKLQRKQQQQQQCRTTTLTHTTTNTTHNQRRTHHTPLRPKATTTETLPTRNTTQTDAAHNPNKNKRRRIKAGGHAPAVPQQQIGQLSMQESMHGRACRAAAPGKNTSAAASAVAAEALTGVATTANAKGVAEAASKAAVASATTTMTTTARPVNREEGESDQQAPTSRALQSPYHTSDMEKLEASAKIQHQQQQLRRMPPTTNARGNRPQQRKQQRHKNNNKKSMALQAALHTKREKRRIEYERIEREWADRQDLFLENARQQHPLLPLSSLTESMHAAYINQQGNAAAAVAGYASNDTLTPMVRAERAAVRVWMHNEVMRTAKQRYRYCVPAIERYFERWLECRKRILQQAYPAFFSLRRVCKALFVPPRVQHPEGVHAHGEEGRERRSAASELPPVFAWKKLSSPCSLDGDGERDASVCRSKVYSVDEVTSAFSRWLRAWSALTEARRQSDRMIAESVEARVGMLTSSLGALPPTTDNIRKLKLMPMSTSEDIRRLKRDRMRNSAVALDQAAPSSAAAAAMTIAPGEQHTKASGLHCAKGYPLMEFMSDTGVMPVSMDPTVSSFIASDSRLDDIDEPIVVISSEALAMLAGRWGMGTACYGELDITASAERCDAVSGGVHFPVVVRDVARASAPASASNGAETKRIIFIDEPLLQRTYTEREKNAVFFEEALRRVLSSAEGQTAAQAPAVVMSVGKFFGSTTTVIRSTMDVCISSSQVAPCVGKRTHIKPAVSAVKMEYIATEFGLEEMRDAKVVELFCKAVVTAVNNESAASASCSADDCEPHVGKCGIILGRVSVHGVGKHPDSSSGYECLRAEVLVNEPRGDDMHAVNQFVHRIFNIVKECDVGVHLLLRHGLDKVYVLEGCNSLEEAASIGIVCDDDKGCLEETDDIDFELAINDAGFDDELTTNIAQDREHFEPQQRDMTAVRQAKSIYDWKRSCVSSPFSASPPCILDLHAAMQAAGAREMLHIPIAFPIWRPHAPPGVDMIPGCFPPSMNPLTHIEYPKVEEQDCPRFLTRGVCHQRDGDCMKKHVKTFLVKYCWFFVDKSPDGGGCPNAHCAYQHISERELLEILSNMRRSDEEHADANDLRSLPSKKRKRKHKKGQHRAADAEARKKRKGC